MTTLTKGILLDIEGTTSSISFVYDQMFPFVRRELPTFLRGNGARRDVRDAMEQIAHDAGYRNLDVWITTDTVAQQNDAASAKSTKVVSADIADLRIQRVEAEVIRLMDDDVKATGLKMLQGLIWQAGFESGELQAHVYPDVAPALQQWRSAGKDVRIYSSGSVHAQRLFFGHTIAGDLLPFFRGHYDTQIGGKREAASYHAISKEFGLSAAEITFFSDLPAELDAAQQAGMQTRLCQRPGNVELDELQITHAVVTSFT